jgi:hypothetical protein
MSAQRPARPATKTCTSSPSNIRRTLRPLLAMATAAVLSRSWLRTCGRRRRRKQNHKVTRWKGLLIGSLLSITRSSLSASFLHCPVLVGPLHHLVEGQVVGGLHPGGVKRGLPPCCGKCGYAQRDWRCFAHPPNLYITAVWERTWCQSLAVSWRSTNRLY